MSAALRRRYGRAAGKKSKARQALERRFEDQWEDSMENSWHHDLVSALVTYVPDAALASLLRAADREARRKTAQGSRNRATLMRGFRRVWDEAMEDRARYDELVSALVSRVSDKDLACLVERAEAGEGTSMKKRT